MGISPDAAAAAAAGEVRRPANAARSTSPRNIGGYERVWDEVPNSFSGGCSAAEENKREDGALSFRVLDWNVLCQAYTSYLPSCPECPPLEHRLDAVNTVVRTLRPDIVTLQEVERSAFDGNLLPRLKGRGYDGVFAGELGSSHRIDGAATFWSKKRFRRVPGQSSSQHPFTVDNSSMYRGPVSGIVVLEDKLYNDYTYPVGSLVVVCNSHLLFNCMRGDVKLGQIMVVLRNTWEIVARLSTPLLSSGVASRGSHSKRSRCINAFNTPAVLLCGDYNLVPASCLYGFLRDGFLRLRECHAPHLLSGQYLMDSAMSDERPAHSYCHHSTCYLYTQTTRPDSGGAKSYQENHHSASSDNNNHPPPSPAYDSPSPSQSEPSSNAPPPRSSRGLLAWVDCLRKCPSLDFAFFCLPQIRWIAPPPKKPGAGAGATIMMIGKRSRSSSPAPPPRLIASPRLIVNKRKLVSSSIGRTAEASVATAIKRSRSDGDGGEAVAFVWREGGDAAKKEEGELDADDAACSSSDSPSIDLYHPFKLASAYCRPSYSSDSSSSSTSSQCSSSSPPVEPRLTYCSGDRKGCVDYIWYSRTHLEVKRRLTLPDYRQVRDLGDIPNTLFPASDHFPLVADFCWIPSDRRDLAVPRFLISDPASHPSSEKQAKTQPTARTS